MAKQEPSLNPEISDGGLEYSDAFLIENDARFVFQFVKQGLKAGGVAANYLECTGIKQIEAKAWRVSAWDHVLNKRFFIRANYVINATGPFIDKFNRRNRIKSMYKHLFSKGVHLIVKQLPNRKDRVINFFAQDGRLFFIIPMGDRSCIGTTDTRVTSPYPKVTGADREFILDNINKHLLLEPRLNKNDIISERCGVRPLAVKKGEETKQGDWTALSRKHIIEIIHDRNLINIYGGKLTDCLNVGEEVVESIKRLGLKVKDERKKWYGEPPSKVRKRFFRFAKELGIHKIISKEDNERLPPRLWRRFGQDAFKILIEIKRNRRNLKEMYPGTGLLLGELLYLRREEMIVKLEDLLRRRTKISMLHPRHELEKSQFLEEICKKLFPGKAKQKLKEYVKTGHE